MGLAKNLDVRLLSILECPRDHSELRVEDRDHLRCVQGHKYPILDGTPVFLLAEKQQTIGIASASLKAAESGMGGPLYIDTLGLSDNEKRGIDKDWLAAGDVDPVISYLVGATSGRGYANLIGKMRSYPIPDIPLDDGAGELFFGYWLKLGSLVSFGCSKRLEGGRNRPFTWRDHGSAQGIL
jgi:uncharacterized protein YbaR (Trm112 family)